MSIIIILLGFLDCSIKDLIAGQDSYDAFVLKTERATVNYYEVRLL